MRHLIIITAILFAGVVSAQEKPSTMRFDYSVWDFGKINEVDGPVKCVFTFTNIGKKPFVIENVAVSCGCTSPKFSKAPILSGKKGSIEVVFDPTNRPGTFSKNITVTSNNRQNRSMLEIKGTVASRPRLVEDEYPYEVGTTALRLNDSESDFGFVSQGEVKSINVGYVNNSDKSLVFEVRSDLPTLEGEASAKYSVAAHEVGEITLTCDLRNKQIFGMNRYTARLYVDGVLQPRKFPITMIGVDNMKGVDRESAPRAQMEKMFHNFKEAKHGSNLTTELTITNVGESPLKISSCKGDGKTTCSLVAGDTIAPGQTKKIKVTIPTSQYNRGRLFSSIYITMNDPVRPFREIRLVATIN